MGGKNYLEGRKRKFTLASAIIRLHYLLDLTNFIFYFNSFDEQYQMCNQMSNRIICNDTKLELLRVRYVGFIKRWERIGFIFSYRWDNEAWTKSDTWGVDAMTRYEGCQTSITSLYSSLVTPGSTFPISTINPYDSFLTSLPWLHDGRIYLRKLFSSQYGWIHGQMNAYGNSDRAIIPFWLDKNKLLKLDKILQRIF